MKARSIGISDLPTGSFVVSLLLLLVAHLPEVEAGPEKKRDDGKRQAQGEVYLYRVEMGVGIGPSVPCIVCLEDVGAHERLSRRQSAISFKCVLLILRIDEDKGDESLSCYTERGLPIENRYLQR